MTIVSTKILKTISNILRISRNMKSYPKKERIKSPLFSIMLARRNIYKQFGILNEIEKFTNKSNRNFI